MQKILLLLPLPLPLGSMLNYKRERQNCLQPHQ